MSDTDSEAKAMEPEQQQEDEEQEEEEGEQEEVPVPVTRSADEAKAAGNAAFKAGKYADAIEAYSEAITTDPSQPAFYSNRAMCHMKISQWAEARDDGLKASEVDPAFGKGFLRAAQASVQLDAFDEAVTLFGKALAADSSLSSALQEKQKVEDLLRKIAQVEQLLADEEYGRAVAIVTPIVRMGICPESQKLNTMHLQAMVGDRKFAQATTVSASLLRKYGQNPTLVTLRGRCLLYTGQVAAAKQHFKKALQDDPDHRPAQLALKLANKLDRAKEAANTLFKAGKYEEAYAGYTEALEVDPLNDDSNAKVYCNRANTCLKLKRPKDCLADCEQAMKRDGQYAKPYALCGEAHIMIGDQTGDEEAYEQAVRDYDRATDLDPSSQAFDSGLRKAKLELKKSKRKDYYKILELPKDCDDQAAVKKAYRRAALKWHPDKHSGDTEEEQQQAEKMFKDVGEAYAVLSDPQKKQRYDQGADIDELDGGGGGGMPGGMDPNDIFRMFQGQGGFGGGGGGGMPGGFSFG